MAEMIYGNANFADASDPRRTMSNTNWIVTEKTREGGKIAGDPPFPRGDSNGSSF